MSETEEFVDEEFLTDAEKAETISSTEFEERELPESSADETEENGNQMELLEPGMQAVLEQKGGEPSDWALEYRGDSGYRFDGENIRDPEGNIWTNEDAALHQEMLSQWKEGGSAVFFLPDYREQTEEGETLYVTQMMLGEKGEVTYEIHKHETLYPKEEEMEKPEEPLEVSAALWLEIEDEIGEAVEVEAVAETILSIEAAAAVEAHVPETIEAKDEIVVEKTDEVVAEATAETTHEAPAVEIPVVVDASQGTEEKDGPDPWLVELLSFDKLGEGDSVDTPNMETTTAEAPAREEQITSDDVHEATGVPLVISHVESVHEDTLDVATDGSEKVEPQVATEIPHATFDAVLDHAPAENKADLEAIHADAVSNAEHDIRPVSSEHIAEALETVVHEERGESSMEDDSVEQHTEATQIEAINMIADKGSIAELATTTEQAESVRDSAPEQVVHEGLPHVEVVNVVSKTAESTDEPVDANTTQEINDPVSAETSDKEIREPSEVVIDTSAQEDRVVVENTVPNVAPASTPVEAKIVSPETPAARIARSTNSEHDRPEIVTRIQVREAITDKPPAIAKRDEEPMQLQRAEIILRALGLPVPNRATLGSPELMRIMGASNMRAVPFSPPHDRERDAKVGRLARSRSRDGVILEMAA